MRVAGVREFRNRAPELAKGKEIVLVTRHGKLSGIFIPLTDPEALPIELRTEILERLGSAISRHLKKRGVTEKETLRDFEAWKKVRRAGRRRR